MNYNQEKTSVTVIGAGVAVEHIIKSTDADLIIDGEIPEMQFK